MASFRGQRLMCPFSWRAHLRGTSAYPVAVAAWMLVIGSTTHAFDRITMPTPAPTDAATSPPWADLPPDILRKISCRLSTATNYVRFHAVCWSWRETVADRRPALLPWILSPHDTTGHRYACCIFSSKSSALIRLRDRRWVTSLDDGTVRYWLQTSSWTETAARSPVDPLNGSAPAIPVPRYQDEVEGWEENAVGVACADGTVALYSIGRVDRWNYAGQGFDAALRHPGGAEWTLVQRNGVDVPGEVQWRPLCCLNYRHGKIILSNLRQWCIVSAEKADDQQWWSVPHEPEELLSSGGYLVETRGELLWVFVLRDSIYHRYDRGYTVSATDELASELFVLVFELHEAGNGGVPQWVKRDGRSLADRVLFLGPVRSFAVDAASLGMSVGCAYFVKWTPSFCVRYGIGGREDHPEQCRVFKYNFNDEKTEFVEELPLRGNGEPFMWVSPRPVIATKQEMRSRAAHFRMYVGNLSPNVDSNRLRQFFRNHGKVADARIMYGRKTKRSQGFGFVTMIAAKDDKPTDIIARLQGQSLDGRPLQVKLAN